jgi:Flp pilus assembly pilin Flp
MWGDVGSSLVEYALLVALIAVVSMGAITYLGGSSSDELGDAGSAIATEEEVAEENNGPSCATPSRPNGYATGVGYWAPCYDPDANHGFFP